ncbi:hypothetical protein LTR95_007519 [Oleoguttula sp. CCFEE 5521]
MHRDFRLKQTRQATSEHIFSTVILNLWFPYITDFLAIFHANLTNAAIMLPLTVLSIFLPFVLTLPPLQPRQQDCSYYPNQTRQATAPYILRLEGTLTNTTLGYLNAFNPTPYALLTSDISSASVAFTAPSWNTDAALLFWNGSQATEKGLNLPVEALWSPETIAPVPTNGCGSRTISLVAKHSESGECGMAGKKVVAYAGCPAWGTTNDGGQVCKKERFFVCDHTNLDGVSDEDVVVHYGWGATAKYGPICKEVDLVSACP